MTEQNIVYNELWASAGARIGASGSDYLLPATKGTTGQVLKVDGSQNGIFSNFALDDLSDVTISGPSANQLLQYTGSKWVNATVSTPGTQRFTKVVNVPTGAGNTNITTITFDSSTDGYAAVRIVAAGYDNNGSLTRRILDRNGTVRIQSGTATWFGYVDHVFNSVYNMVTASTNTVTQTIKQDGTNTRTVTVLVEVLPQQLSTTGFSIA